VNEPSFPLVPYKDANPDTRDDFHAGLITRWGIDGLPDWDCRGCGERSKGGSVLLSYNVPAPIAYCPNKLDSGKLCLTHNPDLVPAPVE
jgi:hypothetical protein